MVAALGRHLALAGFMGAGKTTVGREVARLTERPFLDTDAEIERHYGPIADLFEEGLPVGHHLGQVDQPAQGTIRVGGGGEHGRQCLGVLAEPGKQLG